MPGTDTPKFLLSVFLKLNKKACNGSLPLDNGHYISVMSEKPPQIRVQKVTGFNEMEIDGYSGFIFTNADGSVLLPNVINGAINRIVRDYNEQETQQAAEEGREPILLPHFSNHNLRHTFCTRLCENESNIKVIQSIMGHSDIQTTLDIYADYTADKKQEVMESLEGKIIIR